MHFISAKNIGYCGKRSDQTLIGSPLTGRQGRAKGRTSHLRECLAKENAEEFHNKGEGHMKSKLEYIWLDGWLAHSEE